MLDYERRRIARSEHAKKVFRRQWLEMNERWTACPNHDKTPDETDSLLVMRRHEEFEFESQFEPDPLAPAPAQLICCIERNDKACGGVWSTYTHFKHP